MTAMYILQIAGDTLVDITNVGSEVQEDVVKSSGKWFNKITMKFLIRLLIDLVSLLILVQGIYYRRYKNKALFMPFAVFNIVIFLITYLLNKVELSLGAAFGLFAVFGIIRYRSEDISIKNLTYLFMVIAIGLMSAVSKGSWEEISFYNFIIILIVFVIESGWITRPEGSKVIVYDNTEMIKPENRLKLLEDLKKRTGYEIINIEVQRIDFLRDSAEIRVFYRE